MNIILTGLFKSFTDNGGSKSVISGLNLSLEASEVFSLFGRNGSGKTTLLKLISGLVEKDSGGISVCGFDTAKEPAKARRSIGVSCDSEKSFYQMLSVYENLRFYAGLFEMNSEEFKKRFSEISSEFGLSDYANIPVFHCSSGVRQRVSLARAFLPSPKVLLLDEPTKSLDDKYREALLGAIKREAGQRQASVLVATHDREIAAYFGARHGVLENGKISEGRL
ncbi:MAG TPA: hypothetical protein DEE98_02735 [Elusimicrobia bacterium]|nr:MAG: hypothetical protein A2278_07565 [Elusimicrobia bacterium RIFOXYA12_FULL_49_49]OGS11119.1 MAG: hypothetical protein A2386_05860 [Elusimicrobia bacterium RIFOXYB1_FULL_48_9]OGS16076.1 MAG: hypothetical protein A2251_02700 [Elusimicrobia bacterium RIFOXYA2_FULL_47_53]OGS26702.1 MAG: hypothetical protein A2339_03750 [Elusimicrobia bacterium RIFOXYB12_FULL_50_12]OGS30172.1 MAG: hypothetical protein A2323_01835 [Elusimicrobia bacterium RIFOXYB2_FULL_46_23]HBU69281.1 hypothetical protein [El